MQKGLALQGETDKSTIIVGDFNILLSTFARTSREKITKDIEDLNNTINNFDLIDIYRKLHSATSDCALVSSTHGNFKRWSHKTSLYKFKRIQVIQRMFSDHNGIKLEINNRKI